jgi:hypothetical protein
VWDRFDVGWGGAPKAIAVATCESALYPGAVGGDNLGLFQHKARYWPGRFSLLIEQNRLRRTWHLSASPFDARTNAIVTALYVRRFGGWWAWSCG